MKTVAFYSYKGGVGRSLLVANAARFLAMLGKRVVALDLDFEAPGLHYKFGQSCERGRTPAIPGGAVPYLVATAGGAEEPPALNDHVLELAIPSGVNGSLQLMPAGPAPRREYWVALKQLRERLHFDEPSGKGLAALLDLHARIEEELKPDYLLIDARTGVTELGGLATTALASCIVCLLVANQESIDGTAAIVEAITSSARLGEVGPGRVIPVFARVTAEMPREGPMAERIQHLVELGEKRGSSSEENPKPFVLPHDSEMGAADRIVGGEAKASAFLPLYKAYLELFQHLFPDAQEAAEEALKRLGAVARLKKALTERRRTRRGVRDPFEPWQDSAIEEGVRLETEGGSTRYADLVCHSAEGEAIVVAEYSGDDDESKRLAEWKKHGSARCLVLLVRKQGSSGSEGYVATKIYCRSSRWEDFEESDRNEPPFPKEFEVFSHVGERSVDQMLEAVQRGHNELVSEIVAQWKECMAGITMPMRGPEWRPVEARRVLDGLAAIENTESGVQILREASRRWEGHHFDERGGVTLREIAENELFAPLFWRLPPDATIEYLRRGDHPFWIPCLAGHRLLAEQVMGLRYDPLVALRDTQSIRRGQDVDYDRALHRIHRRAFHEGRPRQSDEPPPVLVWDTQLREHPEWWGRLESVPNEVQEKAKRLMENTTELHSWLRQQVQREELVTGNLLGQYNAALGRVEIYSRIVEALAPVLGLSSRHLKSVVFMQMSVLAFAHQGRDGDGEPGFGFGTTFTTSAQEGVPIHVTISQYFTHRLILRLGDTNLMAAFEKLMDAQPKARHRWRRVRSRSVEQMRSVLLRARLTDATLGLPGVDPEL